MPVRWENVTGELNWYCGAPSAWAQRIMGYGCPDMTMR